MQSGNQAGELSEARPMAPIPSGKPAAEVKVTVFRQILFWPIPIGFRAWNKPSQDGAGGGAASAPIISNLAGEIVAQSPWRGVADPLAYLRPVADRSPASPQAAALPTASEHGEYVYFYRFVQRFLYDSGDAGERSFILLERTDLKSLLLILGDDQIRLSVDRLHLYLFSPGVAVMAIEVCANGPCPVRRNGARGGGLSPLTLDLAQKLSDTLRRLHVPHWEDGAEPTPGRVPDSVTLVFGDGRRHQCPAPDWRDFQLTFNAPPSVAPGNATPRRDWLRRASERLMRRLWRRKDDAGPAEPASVRGRVPLLAHWASLLPAKIVCRTADGAYRITPDWLPVTDDRMPLMTFIAVEVPHDIRESDWMRLCFVDGPAEQDKAREAKERFAYAKEFLNRDWQQYIYGRFWDDSSKTRYLICDYAFTAAGPAATGGTFYTEVVQDHFRRHYFQMGLLLRFQQAALMTEVFTSGA